jgi:hypothetical protein
VIEENGAIEVAESQNEVKEEEDHLRVEYQGRLFWMLPDYTWWERRMKKE